MVSNSHFFCYLFKLCMSFLMRDIAEPMMHMRCVVHFLWCFLYFVWWKSVFAWWKDFWICLKRFLDLFGPDLQPSWWRVRCNVDSWQRCTTSSSNDARSGRSRERCEKATDVKCMQYRWVWYRYLLDRDLHFFKGVFVCVRKYICICWGLNANTKSFLATDQDFFCCSCICLKSFECIFVFVEPKCKCEMMSCD